MRPKRDAVTQSENPTTQADLRSCSWQEGLSLRGIGGHWNGCPISPFPTNQKRPPCWSILVDLGAEEYFLSETIFAELWLDRGH